MVDARGAINLGIMHGPFEVPSDESVRVVIDTQTKEHIEVPIADAWEYGADAVRYMPSEYTAYAGHAVLPQRVIVGVEA